MTVAHITLYITVELTHGASKYYDARPSRLIVLKDLLYRTQYSVLRSQQRQVLARMNEYTDDDEDITQGDDEGGRDPGAIDPILARQGGVVKLVRDTKRVIVARCYVIMLRYIYCTFSQT